MTPAHAARRIVPSFAIGLVAVGGCVSVRDAPPAAPAAASPPGSAGARSAEREAMRPCRRADLLGTWQVVRMGTPRTVPVDRSDPEHYPHQRFVFASDATMRYLAAQRAITPETHAALASAAAATTWAVDATGRLLWQAEGEPRQEVSTCAVLLKEIAGDSGVTGEVGDVVLTRLDGEGRAVSRRQLRRLTPAPE